MPRGTRRDAVTPGKRPVHDHTERRSPGIVAMLLPEGSLLYPCTIVLDREGVVAGVWRGFTAGGMQEVAQKVRSLL